MSREQFLGRNLFLFMALAHLLISLQPAVQELRGGDWARLVRLIVEMGLLYQAWIGLNWARWGLAIIFLLIAVLPLIVFSPTSQLFPWFWLMAAMYGVFCWLLGFSHPIGSFLKAQADSRSKKL